MSRTLACIVLATAVLLNSGCYYHVYGFNGSKSVLWLPGVGEWTISEESLDREELEAVGQDGFFWD